MKPHTILWKMKESWKMLGSSFTSEQLKKLNVDVDPNLTVQASHALELRLHWRMSRFKARWFIYVYERRGDMNPVLLELAKLDFNIVQGLHRKNEERCQGKCDGIEIMSVGCRREFVS